MPCVSVIMPTCERPHLINRAVESVLSQTFKDLELIIIDDASKDETREQVLKNSDPRIHYIRHESRKGGAAARNTGIRIAKGNYLAFLDDDDEWFPNKLQLQIDLLENSSSKVGLVYSGYLMVDQITGKQIGSHTPIHKGDLLGDLLLYNWVGSTSSVLLRKECLNRVGFFDEKLPIFQDYDLWIRLAKEFHFSYIKDPLLVYYVHGERISTRPEGFRRGLEILQSKLGNSHPNLKENYRYRYLRLGILYCLNGEHKKGRQAYYQAIKLFPFRLKPYGIFLLSFFGPKMLRKILSLRAEGARFTV